MTTLYRAFASVLFAACYLGGAFAGSAHPQSSDPLPHVDLSANSEPRTTTSRKIFAQAWSRKRKTRRGLGSALRAVLCFQKCRARVSVRHKGTDASKFLRPISSRILQCVRKPARNDGDPLIVNYVGHPMQGAVSSRIWTHNDRAYRDIQYPEDAVRGRGTWAYQHEGTTKTGSRQAISFVSRNGSSCHGASPRCRTSRRSVGLRTVLFVEVRD